VKKETVNHGGSIIMPKREKVSAEEKVKLVRRCLAGEIGVREAGRLIGADKGTIRQWIARYEAVGADGFLPRERNRVYSIEVKMNAARDYVSGAGSDLDIVKKYKIRSASTLRKWVKVYNAHGDFNSTKFSGGGSYMKKARNTTQEERVQIVRDCIASGKNYGEMALKYEVSYQQVRTWKLRYEELGEAGLEDRRGRRKKDQTPRTSPQNWKILRPNGT
jgi:transposase-like protein